MKKSVLISLPGFLLACLFSTTHAAEDQVVIEDLSRAEVRAEIKKVQHEFYRIFNLLNVDDKLDIVCHKYIPTSSHITKEACEPQFVIDRRAKNAADWRNSLDDLLSPEALQMELANEFQVLTDQMNAVVAANVYFKDLNSVLKDLHDRLEELNN